MEKESVDAGDSGGKPPPDGLLDAAGLFGAYWGRDGAGGSAAQAQAQAALFGFGGGRYPPPSTLGVAANQAASLGLHPAASAAWWSMASHLAAQDYLHRLQASGLNFPPMGDPYSALSALSGVGMGKQTQKTSKGGSSGKGNDRSGRSSVSSASSIKDKSPSTSSANSQPTMRSSYGFPKTSSPSTHHHNQSLSSLASLNNLVSAPHQKSSKQQASSGQNSRKSSSSQSKGSDRDLSVLRGDLMLAQAAAQGAYHAAVAAAKGKNISSMYPFGVPGSEKDRHGAIDSLTGLPHTILSAALEGGDPASVLGGVRLPPDTEIIKYTSSLAGPKPPGSTSRGRKKTISLDPPHVSVTPAHHANNTHKRHKMDEYGNSRSAVEVIRLPNRPDKHNSSETPPPNLTDYAGISRELLQTIASQSGVSLAALEKQLAGTAATADSGLNLSKKSREESPLDLGVKSAADEDAPLNLSLKPTPASSQASDALSRLTSLSSSLSASNADRISRRKPGAKPRRVAQDGDAPRPRSSGSEDSELGNWAGREGRPRNLGRGVSKPKKNTVASLLAQSRALGLRPALAHQLLAETDLEKLKALLSEPLSTDSCSSDSPSDTDSESGRPTADHQLRLPLALGWKRLTVIKGLSRNCNIKGDVTYSPPDTSNTISLKTLLEIQQYLDSNPCPPLSADNFSLSSRVILGDYIQHAADNVEPRLLNETEITKRVEEARQLSSGRQPLPLERRMETARRQQADRDRRRDGHGREQARLAREMERSERAEMAKREKEVRSQQLLEAKRRKHEEVEKQKIEEQAKRQQERELKRQQSILLKEQERERRRQHTTFIRQLDSRRRWEEKERRKHQNLLDRLLVKEKKLQQRRKEMELLAELRRPQEDSTLEQPRDLPDLPRIPGLKLPGQAMAHLLQVYEFLHNFGQTLGYDMESIPSLSTFQAGLLPDCCADAEEELMQVLMMLLVSAIEDPGIPHPSRHTSPLGHALRPADVTTHCASEMLRVYLYANATGEVKAMTGLSAERERERRIPDHHQTEAEMQQTCASTKNIAYYEQLHSNRIYKLSELLREKPFLALTPVAKAEIMAYLCDELLQNKSVLRQIDASLDQLNQLKKERYLLDMKIRKVRAMHQRKIRAEQSEKQQAMALERMQKLVEESTATLVNMAANGDEEQRDLNLSEKDEASEQDKESSPNRETEGEKETTTPDIPPSPRVQTEESDKESSPVKDASNGMKNKEILNNNKDDCSPSENLKDKDSVMDDCDAALSDLESEGTQPEEDEDKNLSSEELSRKLDKLVRQSEQQMQQLSAGSHALRATCYGQDRYWRRYWSLGKSGGILVEGMESAQPEIVAYQQLLEGGRATKDKSQLEQEKMEVEEVQRVEEALKSELELKSIKSELNLSDHTQIIKYEPNMKTGNCKMQGSSIKMEEKYIQQMQTKEEEDMLDIEDSIPTAFLVQKPTHKPMFASQAESLDKTQEIVKVENAVKNETTEPPKEDESKESIDNLEELRKMAEAVSSQLDAAKKAESEVKEEIKEEKPKPEVKKESLEPDTAHEHLYTKMLEGKWFSILRHESSFLFNINETDKSSEQKIPNFCDNEQTCSEVVMCQGHKWDVSNNLHLLNDPSLFTLNSMVTSVTVPSNNIYLDSSLTMSGLDQDMMDTSLNKDPNDTFETEKEDSKDQENDLEKELQADAIKSEIAQKAKANSLTSLGLLNFNALSTYVTCDSPPPINMSPDEIEQLGHCKINGLPKKIEGNFVPKELRHGWWRISTAEELKDLVEALHPRGVRERELGAALTQMPLVGNKPYIEPGSVSLSPPPRDVGHCDGVARRVDGEVLAMVDAFADRISAGLMHTIGWSPSRSPSNAGGDIVARARQKLADVEAHIERRYLKPPLVQRYASNSDAAIGAAMQAEQGSSTQSQNDGESKERSVSRGLSVWREAVSRSSSSAGVALALHALDAAVAWDKSCMKANCQFCLRDDNDDELLLCDGCDKGYHTYCFKPQMEKIPEGDWYCWECVNKARGSRVCIVCGLSPAGRHVACAACPRAYHLECHYPPLTKNPRGKWYCASCVSKAPAKKPRPVKKRARQDTDHGVPSPSPSHASTSTTAEEHHDTERHDENGHAPPEEEPPEKKRALQPRGNGHDNECNDGSEPDDAPRRKDKPKRAAKEMHACKSLLGEMESHEQAWPFLTPVDTKLFPQYKKVIKNPMDLSTIRKKLQTNTYKTKDDFANDVRLMFSNCERFNEDYSLVGRAGHCMRQLFEEKWATI